MTGKATAEEGVVAKAGKEKAKRQVALRCEPPVVYRSNPYVVVISAEPLGTNLFSQDKQYSVTIADMTLQGYPMQECMQATYLNSSQLEVMLRVSDTAKSGKRPVEIFSCDSGYVYCPCDDENVEFTSTKDPIDVG